MNHKQKLGYTLLGAGIMAVGVTIGAIVCSPLVAQENGFFDKVVCRELEVVDKDGKKAIVLQSNEDDYSLGQNNRVIVYNPQSKHANVVGVKLVAVDSGNNLVQVCDKQGKVAVAVSSTDVGNAMGITNSQGKSTILLLSSDELKNSVRIYDPQGDKEAIRLISNEGINAVSLLDQQEEIAVGLHSAKGADLEKLGNGVLVVDKTRKITTLGD